MHWGEQNGPPYPLDSSLSTGNRLKQTGKPSKIKKKDKKKDKKSNVKTSKKLPTSIKDADLLGEAAINDRKNRDKTRIKEAADLGLKALKMSGRDSYNENEGITNDDREWFLWEDQTIGLPLIADMVRQGYTKEQIGDFIKEADDGDYEEYQDTPGYFDLSYNVWAYKNGYLDDFIDACIDIANKEKKGVKK